MHGEGSGLRRQQPADDPDALEKGLRRNGDLICKAVIIKGMFSRHVTLIRDSCNQSAVTGTFFMRAALNLSNSKGIMQMNLNVTFPISGLQTM